ncbi:hypothetical protein Glove_139g195 [Diversispora epigaea]|uniref:Uncharacterized protein n=1 Tax=Diversispora epigaea TaxID=1348612 RepID=A0A397J5V5_9GLOM|nr:hypothetical protein Glove_139g195 [Diversispora epigaea]
MNDKMNVCKFENQVYTVFLVKKKDKLPACTRKCMASVPEIEKVLLHSDPNTDDIVDDGGVDVTFISGE